MSCIESQIRIVWYHLTHWFTYQKHWSNAISVIGSHSISNGLKPSHSSDCISDAFSHCHCAWWITCQMQPPNTIVHFGSSLGGFGLMPSHMSVHISKALVGCHLTKEIRYQRQWSRAMSFICTYACICIHPCKCISILICISICINIHICIYMHISIYICNQNDIWRCVCVSLILKWTLVPHSYTLTYMSFLIIQHTSIANLSMIL